MVPVLLAPVPSVHIDCALDVNASSVAFGSGSPREESSGAGMWEFFAKLDAEGEVGHLPVCIYASRTGQQIAAHRYVGECVSLVGIYGGSLGADRRGRHPDPSFRPASTLEIDDAWSVFWHVNGLAVLEPEMRVPLIELRTARNGQPTTKSVDIPRGPVRAFAPYRLIEP